MAEKERFSLVNRRIFLTTLLGSILSPLLPGCQRNQLKAETFIARADHYQADLSSIILSGLRELRIRPEEVRDKKILLKPNLVEPHQGAGHINTHPLVVRGAIEAFIKLGASRVIVGEGPGHIRDFPMVLGEAGYLNILAQDHIPFVDLNQDPVYSLPNQGSKTNFKKLFFPKTLQDVDWVVSIAKMKTHHWAGVTLSMKNLFGVMPGSFYGWPKNALHHAGIAKAVFDINATLRPALAIVDGIVGMEGDGPIMGNPKKAGVVVIGRNLPAVDATCCRIMGIDPLKIPYLKMAGGSLGPLKGPDIQQRGEALDRLQNNFNLVDTIPAQKGIRL
jgi:uncharacterized protein (DUF362 family)